MNNYIHKVKYYECDRMGVMHHSNYIRVMEEARVDAMDQMGYGFEKMEAEGIVSPVVSINCDFKRTTTFQDEIEVELSVLDITPLKVTFGYTMKKGGKVCFTGSSVHCFLNGETYRPIVIEQTHPQLFAKLQEMLVKK